MGYNFTAQWIKDTLNNAPDALSCNRTSNPLPHEIMAKIDAQDNPEPSIAQIRVVLTDQLSSLRLQDLHQHAQADQEYQQLQHYIINGFLEHRHQLPEQCKSYWNIHSDLSLDDGLIVYGCCLVVPAAMCKKFCKSSMYLIKELSARK